MHDVIYWDTSSKFSQSWEPWDAASLLALCTEALPIT